MDEVSPFIDSNTSQGGSVKLNNIDMTMVVNILVVMAIIYLLYTVICNFKSPKDSDDEEDDEEQSYIEEQVELLKTRQLKYLN